MVRLEASETGLTLDYFGVSIPIWCDWKNYLVLSSPPNQLFQFLYGAIGSCTIARRIIISSTFQFLYGAIGSYLLTF